MVYIETINTITYKWNQGVYSLNDLLILVQYNQLTPKQFFNITRYNYEVMKEKKEKGDIF